MPPELKDRLLRARLESGYAKRSPAARKIGISASALSQLEDGRSQAMKWDTIQGLATTYPKFRIEWLVEGEEPVYRPGAVPGEEDLQAAYHSLRIDPDTIAASIKLVRLSFLNLGLQIDQEQNGLPLAFAYEYLIERDESEVTADNVVDFSKRLAERLRGDDGAPEPTGNDRGAGAGHRVAS